jgi:hypothetical protein
MARRFFVTLQSVAPGDMVMSMSVGDRLDLPRQGKIECGRVPSLEIVCRGRGQGGRRCFALVVDGDRVVMEDYRHGGGIWVRGAHHHENAELAPGDVFGPCEGIRFVLGADDASVLHDVRRVGRWWCANPRGRGEPVWSAVDLDDPQRDVVDLFIVNGGATRGFGPSAAFADVLHPSWPRSIERFKFQGADVCVAERTAGVPLERIIHRTRELGAAVDSGMAAWLAESVGWCMSSSTIDAHLLERCVVVRFDDGQPVFEPWLLRTRHVDDTRVSTWLVAALLRELAYVPPNDRVARALAAADNGEAGRTALLELLAALAEAREESGGDMRAAWHGLVQRLFPEDAAADRDVVDALRVLGEDDARALLGSSAPGAPVRQS